MDHTVSFPLLRVSVPVSGSHCVQPAGGLHEKKVFRDCILRTTEPLSARDLSSTHTTVYFRRKVFMHYFLGRGKHLAQKKPSALIVPRHCSLGSSAECRVKSRPCESLPADVSGTLDCEYMYYFVLRPIAATKHYKYQAYTSVKNECRPATIIRVNVRDSHRIGADLSTEQPVHYHAAMLSPLYPR